MSKQDKTIPVTEVSTRFIGLANELKNEGLDVKLISSALMQASAVYATYAAAGNNGFLQESGVEKVADVFRNGLAELQKVKRAALEAEGLKPVEKTAPMPVASSPDK
jgi:hypothetical protein